MYRLSRAGFFHKIFGGGPCFRGGFSVPPAVGDGVRWGRIRVGDEVRWGGTWKNCPLRPKMAPYIKIRTNFGVLSIKLSFLMYFWAKKLSKLRENEVKFLEFSGTVGGGENRLWSKSRDSGRLRDRQNCRRLGGPQSPWEKTCRVTFYHVMIFAFTCYTFTPNLMTRWVVLTRSFPKSCLSVWERNLTPPLIPFIWNTAHWQGKSLGYLGSIHPPNSKTSLLSSSSSQNLFLFGRGTLPLRVFSQNFW